MEDRFPYMGGWVDSDVAISRNRKGERVLEMSTSYLWQLAETHALFGWSVVGLRMTLTLEGPKLQVVVEAPLEKLDEAIKKSAESGWLKMLGTKAELKGLEHVKSWDDLKRWVVENWGVVVEAAARRLRKMLKEEELERLLAQVDGDVAKRRKGGQDAPRDKQIDGENVWEELRHRLNALRDLLNDDKIAREVVVPALLLIQAERLGVNEETLRYLAAVASGAIGGDGYVSAAMKRVELTSGKHAVALLWTATLAAYGIKAEVRGAGRGLKVVASGIGAVRLAGLYFRYGSPLLEGDERVINHKLYEAMKLRAEEGLDIRWEGLRRKTEGGPVAADLIISVDGDAVKYNVYLHDAIVLQFRSTDRSHAELAARLLKLAGVSAEMKKVGKKGEWHVWATTRKLAAGREELRDALAEIVRKAVENDWVNASTAERWLEKLEKGLTLMEGWPMYSVGLKDDALMVRYHSTNPESIKQETQRLRKMGLVEGKHFTVKMPEEGREGYVSILRKGLERAAKLSVRGEGEQQKLAARFVERILQRAWEAGEEVYKKAKEIVEEGKARGSIKLEDFEKKVEVNGKTYVVKVKGGEAVEEDRGGRKLLRIRITAEIDGVRGDYTITYGRYGKINAAKGFVMARAETDAERLSALIKALTGKEPRIYRMKDGRIKIECYEGHLEGFMRYEELADAIEEWLEETSRR